MLLRLLRWWLVLLGGICLGAGLFLHGQIALARAYRSGYDETFFLWRQIGHATFFLQGADHRIALTLSEVPAEVIDESDRAAWALLVIGGLFALSAPWVRTPLRARPPKPARPGRR